MKQLIVNNSDLTNTDIGKFLDQIKETHQGETIYYGKVDRIWFLHKGKRYRLDIKYLKRYTSFRFKED